MSREAPPATRRKPGWPPEPLPQGAVMPFPRPKPLPPAAVAAELEVA